jgi:hypothetical protein
VFLLHRHSTCCTGTAFAVFAAQALYFCCTGAVFAAQASEPLGVRECRLKTLSPVTLTSALIYTWNNNGRCFAPVQQVQKGIQRICSKKLFE